MCPKCSDFYEGWRDAAVPYHTLCPKCKARTYLEICPQLYRDTDPAKIPVARLEAINAWQFGAKGMLLAGPPRTHKTRVMFLLLKRIIEENHKVFAISGTRFARECAEEMMGDDYCEWFDKLLDVPVLLIDDIDKPKFTERVESELFSLIDERISACRPVLVTTNSTWDDLEKRFTSVRGEAIVSRLEEFCEIVTF